jgi:hypothetical protein
MKKGSIATLIAATLVIGGQVLAEENVTTPSAPEISAVTATIEKAESITEKRTEKVRARGERLVNERISTLTRERNTVTKSKLTDAQKKELTDMIDLQIAALTAVKVTLTSTTTDATSTKYLTESIFTDYRTYGVMVPKIRLETRIYTLQNHIAKITGETFVKVQANIDVHKAKGQDVTAWQAGLDKAKATVATDTTTLAGLLTKVQGLKASDYGTTSKDVIQSTNTSLKSVSKDLRTINTLIKSPRYMKNVTSTSTGATTTVHQ